jgi:putative transposase
VHAELHPRGTHVARKRVARLMRQAGLHGVSRHRFITTTRCDLNAQPAEDLV